MSRTLSFLCFKFSWNLDRATEDDLNLKDVQITQPGQPDSTSFLPERPVAPIHVVVTDTDDNDSSRQALSPATPSIPLQRVPSTTSSTRGQAVQYGVIAVKAIMPLAELCGPFKASLGLLLGALERMDKMYTNDAEFKDMMDQLLTIAGLVPMEENIDADMDEYDKKLHQIARTLNGKIMELGQELTESMRHNGIIQADRVANVIANTKSRLGAHIQEAQLSLNFLQVTLQVQDMRARKTAERERRALQDGELSATASSPTDNLIVKRKAKTLNHEQIEDPGPRILPGTSISPPTPVETVSAPTERPSYMSTKETNQSSSIILRPVETKIPQDMIRGSASASEVSNERSVRRPNDIPFFDLYGDVIWVPYYVALTSANFLLFVQTVLFCQNDVHSRIHQRVLQRPDTFFIVSSTGWPASLSTQISIFVRRRWVLLPGKSFPSFLDLLGSSTWDMALGPLIDWAKRIPIFMAESHIDWERQPDRVISESFVSDSSVSSVGDPKTEFSMSWTILTNDMAINPLISETQKFNEFVIVDPTCTSPVYYQTDMSAERKLSVVVVGGIVHTSSHIGQGDTHELAEALYSEALRSQIG